MPIARYGVWKGEPLDWQGSAKPDHGYLFFTDTSGDRFKAAVNVMSKSEDTRLVYWFIRDFARVSPVVDRLRALPLGFHSEMGPDSLALDYLRGTFLDIDTGTLLSHNAPGESHDILEFIDPILDQAVAQKADVYIFGQRFHNDGQSGENGMHDIHMNQGNHAPFEQDNGVFQDGGIIMEFPDGHWEAIFLAFAVQAFETDDEGRPITDQTFADLLSGNFPQGGEEGPNVPAPRPSLVSIEAALINPFGPDQHPTHGEGETVYLHNSSTEPMSLEGWSISNGIGQKQPLHGIRIGPQSKKAVIVPKAPLSNKGGSIVLVDANGKEVHRVTYSKEKAKREGVLVFFN
ncbi:hypothetical protein QBC47DRAFT_430382 [Echria macrotheca]|uniref:LTD domain-containing protein n=1 Tax=Echria macrotheca TaxID=438768 RepID=A0AAJ0F3L1_9PEZI|nr:hypothetical protein QBC47DRAFT_430382 [Echria macrotheca]